MRFLSILLEPKDRVIYMSLLPQIILQSMAIFSIIGMTQRTVGF